MQIAPILFQDLLQELSDGDVESLAGRLFQKRDRGKNIRLALLILTAVYYTRTRRRLTFKTDARYLIYAPPSGLPVYRADERADIRERLEEQTDGPDRRIVYDVRNATRMPG